MKNFIDYVLTFYGPNGIYESYFKRRVTKKRIQAAIKTLKNSGHNFVGDSIDREKVRDIMLAAEAPLL